MRTNSVGKKRRSPIFFCRTVAISSHVVSLLHEADSLQSSFCIDVDFDMREGCRNVKCSTSRSVAYSIALLRKPIVSDLRSSISRTQLRKQQEPPNVCLFAFFVLVKYSSQGRFLCKSNSVHPLLLSLQRFVL